jgi:hypothetical protein
MYLAAAAYMFLLFNHNQGPRRRSGLRQLRHGRHHAAAATQQRDPSCSGDVVSAPAAAGARCGSVLLDPRAVAGGSGSSCSAVRSPTGAASVTSTAKASAPPCTSRTPPGVSYIEVVSCDRLYKNSTVVATDGDVLLIRMAFDVVGDDLRSELVVAAAPARSTPGAIRIFCLPRLLTPFPSSSAHPRLRRPRAAIHLLRMRNSSGDDLGGRPSCGASAASVLPPPSAASQVPANVMTLYCFATIDCDPIVCNKPSKSDPPFHNKPRKSDRSY